mmetsp:Transcript_73370/g.122587  ORF Transcript_73370/g.122587 Transcript_73370/m.122587 type:complete len:278 (-) Transcript_73370:16-849(-)
MVQDQKDHLSPLIVASPIFANHARLQPADWLPLQQQVSRRNDARLQPADWLSQQQKVGRGNSPIPICLKTLAVPVVASEHRATSSCKFKRNKEFTVPNLVKASEALPQAMPTPATADVLHLAAEMPQGEEDFQAPMQTGSEDLRDYGQVRTQLNLDDAHAIRLMLAATNASWQAAKKMQATAMRARARSNELELDIHRGAVLSHELNRGRRRQGGALRHVSAPAWSAAAPWDCFVAVLATLGCHRPRVRIAKCQTDRLPHAERVSSSGSLDVGMDEQ